MSSWITRTPAIRDAIDVSLAGMGVVLLCISLGSICGILLSGFLVERIGSKPLMLFGMSFLAVGISVVGLGCKIGSAEWTGLGFLFFGLGMGLAEVAINVEGAAVEKLQGTPLMHILHGCYSLGTVLGSVIGFWIAAVELAVSVHLWGTAVVVISSLWYSTLKIPSKKTAQEISDTTLPTSSGWRDWRSWFDKKLGLLAVVILFMGFAEGAANDWLPILLVDEHGFTPAMGSLGFFLFALIMTGTRLSGGVLLNTLGPVRALQSLAVVGLIGIVMLIVAESDVVAGLAIVLWAVGTSLGFPVAISLASKSHTSATLRVNFLTIAGYIAFLVSPPSLGFIGQVIGLRLAMLVVAFGFLAVATLTGFMVRFQRAERVNA